MGPYIEIKGLVFFYISLLLGIKLATGKWDNEEYAARMKGRQTTMLKIVVYAAKYKDHVAKTLGKKTTEGFGMQRKIYMS